MKQSTHKSVCLTGCITNVVVCDLVWDAAAVYVIVHSGENITSSLRRLSWTTLTFISATPFSILVINQLNTNSCFIISLLYVSACFEHYVLVIRRSELFYTASGIVTLCRWPSRAQSSLNLRTGWPPTECDDTRYV